MQHFHYDSLDSTNLQALRLWNEVGAARPHGTSPPAPFAVTAGTQTAGLGRAGRTWQSPSGGLWLSIAWPAAQPLPHYQSIPLVVGLATLRTLVDLTFLDCQIKWPNDILLADRKLAGILCQAHASSDGPPTIGNGNWKMESPPIPFLILGIGINANFPTASLGTNLRTPPITLRDALARDINLADLTAHLLANIESTLTRFDHPTAEPPLTPFLPELRNHLAWRGQTVTVTDTTTAPPPSPITGTLLDLDAAGQLLLQTPAGIQTITIGDLQLSRSPVPLSAF